MPLLHRLFSFGPDRKPTGKPTGTPDFPPLPRPAAPICLIGDVHGRADLLEEMLTRIAVEPESATARLIFVGDLIDRGPDSALVLRRLHDLTQARPRHVICLMGNHERMLLDFLDAPTSSAKRWLHAGGAETLASFGVPWISGADAAARQTGLAAALRAALPPDLLAWLMALPLYWQGASPDEPIAVVHADADPALPLDAQLPATLIWGQGRAAAPRPDGIWLAHGHVITPEVQITPGRISLDTGAFRTGRLSALWLGYKGHHVLDG